MTNEATGWPQEYLGDGVYASFDGWQIWLAVNDHHNKVVALEPSVLSALNHYANALRERLNAEHELESAVSHG